MVLKFKVKEVKIIQFGNEDKGEENDRNCTFFMFRWRLSGNINHLLSTFEAINKSNYRMESIIFYVRVKVIGYANYK
jgi:hypothetical protein